MLWTRSGYTVVEVLVVIVVLGILATLTVVGYDSWQSRALETRLAGDLKAVSAAMEDHRNFNNEYPVDLPDNISIDPDTSVNLLSDGEDYCAQATSNRDSSVTLHIKPASEPAEGECQASWSAISAGGSHTCGISYGRAYCWGSAVNGRLGNGQTSGNFSTPQPVDRSVMTGTVTSISNGSNHTCAVADAKAYCWGTGSSGRLGNGSTDNQSSPVPVTDTLMTGDVTEVSAALNNSGTCAVADAKAYCWGAGYYGDLGNGTSGAAAQSNVPVSVSTSLMSGRVSSVSSSGSHSCAVSAGKVFCWGLGNQGQVGQGSTSSPSVPVAILATSMPDRPTHVSTGNSHTCAIASSRAYCWGSNSSAQIGDSTFGTTRNSPVAVTTSSMSKDISAISAGSNHSCAISGGKAYCWGSNSGGQIGHTSSPMGSVNAPIYVNTSSMSGTVTSISSGTSHTCAVADKKAYCWGTGTYDRLGNGSTAIQYTPVEVSQPSQL